MPPSQKSAAEKISHAVESAIEGTEHVVTNAATQTARVAKGVANTAEQYTDSVIIVEEAAEGGSSTTPETEDNEMEGVEGAGEKKLTMEERAAKLAQLRKKFVRVSLSCL